jgi:predicted DNA-binding transcriptional regulator YafY
LEFVVAAADYVREKKWHESQLLRELRGGGVELRMKLSSLMEIECWILSWGGDATVVKPRESAEAVKQSAKKILQVAWYTSFAHVSAKNVLHKWKLW